MSGSVERAALLAHIEERQDEVGGHAAEARAAEAEGLSAAAVRAWQLVLRDNSEDREAWRSLARLYEERGEARRASACRTRLAELSGHVPETEAEVPQPHEVSPAPAQETQLLAGPDDADLVRFVHLFAGREDVHARMWREPRRGVGYSPVRRPLTPEVARDHLSGALTAGIYLMRPGDTVTLFVLDLDATPDALARARLDAREARALASLIHDAGLVLLQATRALGLAPLLVDSGFKGRHLWCFLERETAAAEVRRFGKRLVAAIRPEDARLQLELFPRQDRIDPGGLGNLVKLPLGIHLRSGRRAALLDDAGQPLEHPLARLRQVARTPLPDPATLPRPAAEPGPKSAPAPMAPARPEWTEADFDASPEVGPVLRGCAVLRRVVEQALERKRLEHAEAVALRHTLGHSPDGVRACNYLFERIPGFPEALRLKSPLRGNPTSCAKVRSRLPGVVAQVPCDCSFPEEPGRYPNPNRHLELAPPPSAEVPPLDDLLESVARQRERLRRLADELGALERACIQALEAVPGRRWASAGGEWRVGADGRLDWFVLGEE
jgi:hypothetical protein